MAKRVNKVIAKQPNEPKEEDSYHKQINLKVVPYEGVHRPNE